MKELLFLEALLNNLSAIEASLGNDWPYYKEQLLSSQKKIVNGLTNLELVEIVDELLDLLLLSNAAELVRQLYEEASNDQNKHLNKRSLATGESFNPNDILLETKVVSNTLALSLSKNDRDREKNVSVPVFYATDRARENNRYGSNRGSLEYGVAVVNIPHDHRIGKLERPNWWKLQLKEAVTDHVMLTTYSWFDQDAFVSNFSEALTFTAQNSVLVFIHGYNVTFEDSIRRAGQLVYDLNYKGLALVYSWPSMGSFLKYTVDEANIEWTVPHLSDVFRLLRFEIRVDTINIIAHSMGNRALVNAMRLFYQHPSTLNLPSLFEQVILAAPDIDRDTFKDIISELAGKARRFTLYASSRDRALSLSKRIHGYPRAGDSGNNILTVKDTVDTIDATYVDTSFIGHSYFGDNRSILTDIFSVFDQNTSPPRFGMTRMELFGLPYWIFKP